MTSHIAWELYRSFLAVLNEGSLSGAARALGLTQPTVGRHVAALEQALGVALFTRSPAGLNPTEAAQTIRSHAEAMESTAASLERVVSEQGAGQAVRGVVRISASEVIGVEILPPILAGLQRAHPGLRIELVLSNRVQDLLRREADIAVRMLRPQQEQLLARRIGTIEVGLHARADYLERCGMPQTPAQLHEHALIGYDRPSAFVRKAGEAFPEFARERFAFAADSDLAQLALVRAGAGIGACQCALARRTPALTRVLPQYFALQLETWVTMHEDLRTSPRCRLTFDALVEGLLAYLA